MLTDLSLQELLIKLEEAHADVAPDEADGTFSLPSDVAGNEDDGYLASNDFSGSNLVIVLAVVTIRTVLAPMTTVNPVSLTKESKNRRSPPAYLFAPSPGTTTK